MHVHLRCRYALAAPGLFAFVLLHAGCAQPVREDRSINWSGDGGAVGFQHGKEGVFLADKDGQKLIKIFQPKADVIATSTPLWSPDGKRVLFTTARAPNGQPPVNLPFSGGSEDPAGKLHFQHDIIYTCWLYEKNDGGKPAEPVALFEAPADHPGYVAANLAVRWHPHLPRIDYVQQVAPHQHGLFESDLATKQSRQIFPHTSEAVLFDWTPGGSHLVCVLGSMHTSVNDGIWIDQQPQADWWHVPDSGELASGEFGTLLEKLRSTRPAWTSDGSRFAFPSYLPDPTPQKPGRHFLRHATLATHAMDTWAEGDQPFRDLLWDRAGLRLGVVKGGSLHLAQQGKPLSPAINRAPVRRFAGWSAGGERLAYVAPDELPLSTDEPWALLLIADPMARDKVYVAKGEGTEPGKPVFSGMRVTFPQWSPNEDKLSLWVTFMPACRSVLSHLLGWGLRPGDPAAVFDLKTEKLGWMPINAQEKVQVGHYYLLKKEYAQAWRWYEEAERELPPPAPVEAQGFMEDLRAFQGPRDFRFFEYICLTKLGRAEEARVKLQQFRRHFLPKFAEPANGEAVAAVNGKTLERHLQDLLDPSTFLGALLQDLYVAEVFLSLDSHPDGEVFFRTALGEAKTDPVRLSRAIVLGQILLLQKKHQDYADLATEIIAPLLVGILGTLPAGGQGNFLDATFLTEFVGQLALAPLGASEFLSRLPKKQLAAMKTRWEKLPVRANDGSSLVRDFVLQGLYQARGQQAERQVVAARLKNRPGSIDILAGEGEVGTRIVALHAQMQALLQRR